MNRRKVQDELLLVSDRLSSGAGALFGLAVLVAMSGDAVDGGDLAILGAGLLSLSIVAEFIRGALGRAVERAQREDGS